MNLHIYEWNVLEKYFSDFSLTSKDLKEILLKHFPQNDINNLNIIFVSSEHIKKLNKDFRKKDTDTDVLSFVIQEEPLDGEIYVCPEYISKKYDSDEILRDIVHGFLHILGYEHSEHFDPDSKEKEKMFVKQENILQNILDEINNRIR